LRIRLKKKAKKRARTPSEIERVVAMAKRTTPEEFKEFTSSTFEKDLQFFKRLVTEQRRRHAWARKKTAIQHLLKKVEDFYDDLIIDGYIKKDLSLFEGSNLEAYKVGQAREEETSLLKELRIGDKDYKKVFQKANRAYVINYETLCDSYLVALAQKVSGRPIRNKARVLHSLSSYRDKKHEELFRSLIPQIRNSISHQDFLIDPKQPRITFYDRRKPACDPITLSLEKYADIFWESFFLVFAFDIADFDLRSGILDILIEAIDIVNDYATKHDLRFVRGKEAPLSLLDWAVLIKSGKISSILKMQKRK